MFSSSSITQLVTNCPKLKHANFKNTKIDDTALAMMSTNCPDMEYLNISGCRSVTEDGLQALDLPNLKIFTESDEDYNDEDV